MDSRPNEIRIDQLDRFVEAIANHRIEFAKQHERLLTLDRSIVDHLRHLAEENRAMAKEGRAFAEESRIRMNALRLAMDNLKGRR